MPTDPNNYGIDPSGKTPPGSNWKDAGGKWHVEPFTDEQKKQAQQNKAGADYYAAAQAAANKEKYELNIGNRFGDRMAGQAEQTLPMVGEDVGRLNADRALTEQSYGQQQQALSMLRAQAQGQGPSVAALQGQYGIDQAGRQMMGSRGASMTGAMMSGAPQAAADQAALGRAQEIAQAQGAWGQGAGTMRGQSMMGQEQAYKGAGMSSDLQLGQMQQDMQRELAFRRLSLQGYQAQSGMLNSVENAKMGYASFASDQQRARDAALLNSIGSGIGAGASMAGSAYKSSQKKPPGGYSGSD